MDNIDRNMWGWTGGFQIGAGLMLLVYSIACIGTGDTNVNGFFAISGLFVLSGCATSILGLRKNTSNIDAGQSSGSVQLTAPTTPNV